jgi:hypothetical protein
MFPTTMPRRGRRQRLDHTPCAVDVTPGIVVYWDGEHRSGRLHDVPTYLAMHWRKHSWATIADEPVGAGAASNTPDINVQAAATIASTCESDELRDTSTDPDDAEDPLASTPLPGKGSPPGGSARFSPYGFPQNPLAKAIGAQQDPYTAGVVNDYTLERDRTGSVRSCGRCGEPVTGRRKWCSEACRLQAYRGREQLHTA